MITLGRDEVLDLLVSLLLDPEIDACAGCFRLAGEIDLGKLGVIEVPRDGQEVRHEVIALLAPEPVGHVELEARLGRLRAKLPENLGEGFRKLILGDRKVQDVGHLLGRLAPGASVGHGQSRGNAAGRDEQVSRLIPQLLVKVQSKPAVSFDEAGHANLLANRRRADGRSHDKR